MTTDDTSSYREALEAVIEATAANRQPPAPRTEKDGKVVDLIASLQESVRKAQAARRGYRGRRDP